MFNSQQQKTNRNDEENMLQYSDHEITAGGTDTRGNLLRRASDRILTYNGRVSCLYPIGLINNLFFEAICNCQSR